MLIKKFLGIIFFISCASIQAAGKSKSTEQIASASDDQIKASLATIDRADKKLQECADDRTKTAQLLTQEKNAAQALNSALKTARELEATLNTIK